MTLTEQQFREMFPNGGHRLDAHWPYVNPALEAARIDNPRRVAAFMAQLAHESAEFLYMEELASGSAYEGRIDLGNTEPGDGCKFKGHGPIQITGRANHYLCGRALGIDLIKDPTLICKPEYGVRSACWFWNDKQLSPLADAGWFKEITRRINGGYTHLDDRVRYWRRNRLILGLPDLTVDGEEDAIREFQANKCLVADGVVGPMTMKALDA